MTKSTRARSEWKDQASLTRTLKPGTLPETLQPVSHPAHSLQGLVATPSSARPADVLHLQRTLGNHAVSALLARSSHERPFVQPKLAVNVPRDKYEEEADRMAERVMRMPATRRKGSEASATPGVITRPPSVHTGATSFEAGDAFEQQVRAMQGQGQPLPAKLRENFDAKFGADFAGVRVHTNSAADQMNRSIQAQAFTTGQDLFFQKGAYDPAGRSGQAVLAHELTHVLQQTGRRPVQGRPSRVSTASDIAIQRLVSKEDFQKLAGKPSTKSKGDIAGGTYTDILKKLKEYENAEKPHSKTKILNELKNLCTKWTTSHIEVGSGSGEGGAKKPKDLRKATYIPGLLEELKQELGEAYDASVDTPTALTHKAAFAMQQATLAVKADSNVQGSRYQLALLASVENAYLLPFAEKRLKETIKNEKKLFGKTKTSKAIKEEAATWVVEEKIIKEQGQQMTVAQKQKAIEEIIDASGDVGHTWIKLRKYDKDDKLIAEHSFGFYPLERYNQPKYAVPGEVVYGDTRHDEDKEQGAVYYDVTAGEYQQALDKALEIKAQRPDYKLIDYNCTAFAKDIVQAAGKKFPQQAFMKVPRNEISAATGIGWGEAYNPNALHGKMNPRATIIEETPDFASLLDGSLGKTIELNKGITVEHVRADDEIAIMAGTAIRLNRVSNQHAYFEVERGKGYRGLGGEHYTDNLAALCVALGLVS